MEPIQIIGIKKLDDMEIDSVNRLANRYFPKVQREIKKINSLAIHIKAYEKEGKQKKYSVHLRIIGPTRIYVSTKAFDWNLEKALHKSFADIINSLHHRLHTDNKRPKAY